MDTLRGLVILDAYLRTYFYQSPKISVSEEKAFLVIFGAILFLQNNECVSEALF